jgi:hypothetical protein
LPSLPSLTLPSLSLPSLTLPSLSRPNLTVSDVWPPSISLPGLTRPSLPRPTLDRLTFHRPTLNLPHLNLPGFNLPGPDRTRLSWPGRKPGLTLRSARDLGRRMHPARLPELLPDDVPGTVRRAVTRVRGIARDRPTRTRRR